MTDISEENTSRFVTVKEGDGELRIHYNEIGSGEHVVVMLHGSGPGASGWANFSRNIVPFAQAGYRVLLIDAPGWSKSDSIVNAGSRSDLNARVVKGVIDALGIERIHILGNSMGGHSAVAFALSYPDNVGKLVLMGGGTGGMSLFAPMPTEGLKLLNGLYAAPTRENLKRFNDVFVYDSSVLTDDLLEARLANMTRRQDHLENFLESHKLNPRQFPDFGPRLPSISAETLIVWGRQDRVVPMDGGLRLVAGIPNSRLHIFNQCGHWAQWEHADAFNRMVIAFLSH